MFIKTLTNILVLPCVQFKMLPPSFILVLAVLSQAGEKYNCAPCITGAAYEHYSSDSYHGKGYAWDVRVKDVEEPFSYAVFIMLELKKASTRFRVLYGDKDHTDHIHIEYRYDIAE